MRLFAVISFTLLLSGCSLNLQELRALSPAADDFPSALAAEYLAYSNAEAEQGRKSAAEYFAGKGLDASKGNTVIPDAVDAKATKALTQARASLIGLLTDDVKATAPQKAARAQLLFDCWNAQAKKKTTAANACADGFSVALSELQEVADSFLRGEEKTYPVYFATDSAALDADAAQAVNDAAAQVKNQKKYGVKLQAREAAAGLAQKRQKAIAAALEKAGVWPDNIRAQPVENDKAVHLSNDEDEQAQDVVDIIVKSGSGATNE